MATKTAEHAQALAAVMQKIGGSMDTEVAATAHRATTTRATSEASGHVAAGAAQAEVESR